MVKKRTLPLLFGLFLLLMWQIFTNQQSLMPTPTQAITALNNLLQNGYNGISFMSHFSISMIRLFKAVFFAILVGLPLGLISGYYEGFRITIEPFINFYKPLPPLSYYVLLIMWLSIDEDSKVMLLFLAAFAPIYVATTSAVLGVNEKYILSAKSLGASNLHIFKTVILPASLPGIMTGIKTAVSVAYTTLASAEMIAATSGLGWIVMDAYNYLKTDVVIAVIFVMGTTGVLLDFGIDHFNQRFIFWKGKL